MNRQTIKNNIIHLVLNGLTLSMCITLIIMTGILGGRVKRTEAIIRSHECPAPTVEEKTENDTQSVITPLERMYVLGAKDGKLTIFDSDGQTVIDTLDTYVYSLPLADREAVAKGISVYSVNELVSLIEDYTS